MKKVKRVNLAYQRGVSKLGLIMLVAFLGVFLTFGLKVAPIYIDNNLITGICRELIENGEAANMTQGEVRQRISNSLRINNIPDFELTNIRMRKVSDAPIITIAYETRVPLIANMDVVVVFDTTLQ
ncbi:MAG: DUF4845 domain-containing protein [Gammaproteobacteria bacterium]|jgi:hypothetical protein|nr:DUF4845 domain-containing protein [Gammaproteobacteria bacterium]|tara:strand:+ start:857 stop:1234 length:378 start_codon:yes stop_codon:yes gene_type:complete